jgi:RNA polymerase-binding transcription factor DksA
MKSRSPKLRSSKLICVKAGTVALGEAWAAKERTMRDTSHFRKRLMARLGELDGRLHEIEDALDAPHSKDWDDAAIEREGDEVLEALGQSGEAEIARIRAALARMRAGEYGVCVRCGEEVSEERLEALPDTPFCRNCAQTV